MTETKRTLGEILMPTKGSDSYPKIANRANEWIRREIEAGKRIGINKMSSEQVRKIFSDEVERPGSIYLEALAIAQNVDVNLLLEVAGYQESTDPIQRVRYALNGMPFLEDYTAQRIHELIDKHRKKPGQ